MATKPRQQEFAPVGGMNQDDSVINPTPGYAGRNAFGEGDYKYLLNARVGSSKSDNFGDVETIKGTTEITSYMVRSAGKKWAAGTRPTGTEKVVGKFENKETQELFYAVYNSNGDHCIRFYNPFYNAVFELLKWSGLNYTTSTFVKMAMIDNWLATTDRESPPRLMDINTITDLKNALGSSFREYHISFHKWAPVMPPVLKATYDSVTNNNEKFLNKVYQFSYRYIYNGRLKSRWSPISMAAQNLYNGQVITTIELQIPGFNYDDPESVSAYNYFNNDNSKFYNAVEFIEIGYRESGQNLWRLFKRYEVEDSGNTTFNFDGDANSTPIPIDDFYQLFDTVPLLAGTVEAVDNRFVFADCLDENEPANIPAVTDIGVASWDRADTNDNWWNKGFLASADNETLYTGLSAADADELGQRVRISSTTFKGRGIYKVGIQWIAASGWRSAVYTTDDWIYDIPEESGIVDKLYALEFKLPEDFQPPEWAVAYQIMRTNCLNIDYFMFGAINEFTFLIDDAAAYADNLEVPATLRDRLRQHFENARIVTGQLADKYLGVLLNKPLFRSLASDVRRTTATATLANASRLHMNINNWYNSSDKNGSGTQNNPLNQLFYNYREGDRVRFLASTSATPATADKVVYDVPILEFTGKGIVIEKPDGILWLPNDNADSEATDFIIEVYTPRIPGQSDFIYHECGEWYPVLYPGTANRSLSKTDWTFSTASAITADTYGDVIVFHNRPMSYGDCHAVDNVYYYDLKSSVTASPYALAFTASMNPDRYKTWDYWDKCTGREAPAYTDLPVSQFKPTQARFGGQIVEESFVNQLNRFREEDQKIYPSEYGRIRNLVATANAQVESVGTILLALGEREAFSIYVNRTTLEDLSGSTQVALSQRVLGSYNTLLGSHGCLNPESVSLHRGRVWYWDAVNGTWVRYGRDGLTPISKYKMRNWFKELGRLVINEYPVINSDPPVINSLPSWTDGGNGAASWGLDASFNRKVVLGAFQTSNWLYAPVVNPVDGTYEFQFSATGTVAGGSGNTGQLTVHFLDAGLNIIESSSGVNIPNAGAVDVAVSLAASPNAPTYVMIQVNNLTGSSNTIAVSVFTLENGTDLTPPIVHETPLVISEFDSFHEELVTFMNHSELPATFRDYSAYKGAVFSEDDTRWKYIHNFEPEMFGRLNDQLFSFKGGSLYKHEASDTYSTFYGVKYDVKIEPVFTDRTMKSWQAISIIATHGWSVERFLSEYRGAKTKQQSSIELSVFEEREDCFYAAIKMDQNTPVVSYPLINGNKMRSKALRALLKLDPSVTTLSLLHYVLVGEIDSPKNS